jgi:predicted HicB family RNase H-like nuclease
VGDRTERNRRTAPARNRYNEPVTFRLRRDGSDGISRAQITAAAEAAGQSVNAWIVDAIKQAI